MLQQVAALGETLVQTTFLGLQQLTVGTVAVGLGSVGMLNDYLKNETTYIDVIGSNPRTITMMGAGCIREGLKNLLPAVCVYTGTALINRHIIQLY